MEKTKREIRLPYGAATKLGEADVKISGEVWSRD